MEPETGALVRELPMRAGASDVTFRSDGGQVAAAGADREVHVWDVASGATVASLSGHTWKVLVVAFAPGNRLLASGGGDGRTLIWDLEKRSLARGLPVQKEGLRRLCFSPDGAYLATLVLENRVQIWDVHTGTLVSTAPARDDVLDLAWSPDGARMAVADRTTVRVMSLRA